MSATSAMPATAHGRAVAKPVCCAWAAGAAPTAVPHRWQNFAPAVSDEPQPEQGAPSSGAPQLAQKRPLAAALQFGQVMVGVTGDDMARNVQAYRSERHCELCRGS